MTTTTKPRASAKDRLPHDYVRVRGLTLWRPWALAILAGPKRVENRPRAWNIQGELLALHNGLRFDHRSAVQIAAAWEDYPGVDEPTFERLTTPGLIVGVARVAKVATPAELGDEHRLWATGPICYVLDRPVVLPKPIPWQGQQGLFNVTGEPADEIRRAWFELRHQVEDGEEVFDGNP